MKLDLDLTKRDEARLKAAVERDGGTLDHWVTAAIRTDLTCSEDEAGLDMCESCERLLSVDVLSDLNEEDGTRICEECADKP